MNGYADIRSPFPQAANTQRVSVPHQLRLPASGVFALVPFPQAYIPRKVWMLSGDPNASVGIAFHAGNRNQVAAQTGVQLTPGQTVLVPANMAPPGYISGVCSVAAPFAITVFFECDVELRTSVPTL